MIDDKITIYKRLNKSSIVFFGRDIMKKNKIKKIRLSPDLKNYFFLLVFFTGLLSKLFTALFTFFALAFLAVSLLALAGLAASFLFQNLLGLGPAAMISRQSFFVKSVASFPHLGIL